MIHICVPEGRDEPGLPPRYARYLREVCEACKEEQDGLLSIHEQGWGQQPIAPSEATVVR